MVESGTIYHTFAAAFAATAHTSKMASAIAFYVETSLLTASIEYFEKFTSEVNSENYKFRNIETKNFFLS